MNFQNFTLIHDIKIDCEVSLQKVIIQNLGAKNK